MIAEAKKSLSRTQRLAAAAAFAIAGFAAAALPGATVAVVGIGASIAMSEAALATGKKVPGISNTVGKKCGGPCPTARKVKKQPPRSTGPRRPN